MKTTQARQGDHWLLMNRVPGKPLEQVRSSEEFSNINILQISLEITLKLLNIVKSMHKKEVYHCNLSPSHVMVEFLKTGSPIPTIELTVLDFSEAFISPDYLDSQNTESMRLWHVTAQNDIPELKATIDTSGVCAILFWLMTNGTFQPSRDTTPRQCEQREIKKIIQHAAAISGMHQ